MKKVTKKTATKRTAKVVKKKKLRPATVDPRYIRVPNINFSLANKNDTREKMFKKQRLKYGFDASELWSLRNTIAKFIYPRLKEFRNQLHGCPCRFDKNGEMLKMDEMMKMWADELDEMLFAFHYYANEDDITLKLGFEEMKKMMPRVNRGMNLFVKQYNHLWN